MARREELLISRSRTLRSRRAFAASSLRWSSLLWPGAGLLGLSTDCGSGDVAPVGSVGDTCGLVDSGGIIGGGFLPESDRAILDLRLDVYSKRAVVGDCV